MTTPTLPGLGRYVIPTNQVEEFVNVGVLWIRQSLPGGLVFGRQRIGKSTAANVLDETIARIFGGTVGSVIATVEPDTVTRPKLFWGGLLESMKIDVPANKSAEVRRSWFVGRIIEAAASSTQNKVAIIIDEASLLSESAWLWLLGVDNTIRQTYGVDATWIFVGQPELANAPALMLGFGRREVVGRFMTDTYEFREMEDLEDFKRALAAFDNLKDSSGHSLTQHANPAKFEAGWRFRNDAELIYEAVGTARASEKIEARDGMTMQAFVRLASHLVVETVPSLDLEQSLTQQHVLDAISVTNCMIFERHSEFLRSPVAPRRRGDRTGTGS